MAGTRELYELMYSDYQPRLEGSSQEPACQRLLNNRDLSIDELLEMYRQEVHYRFPDNLHFYSILYICARIAYAALHSDSFTGEKAKYFLIFASYIQQNQQGYHPSKEAHTLLAKVTSTMIRSENLSEMNELYEVMAWIENFNCIEDFEHFKCIAESRYTYIIGIEHSQIDSSSTKKHLEGMACMAELAVPYDFETQKITSAGLGMAAYEEARTDEEKADIALLMKKMHVQSENTKRMIDDLVARHSQSASQGQLQNSSQVWVTNKIQLQLKETPFYCNTNGEVHLYKFRGIFPYSDTHQFPVVVKEYHAKSREELWTFMSSEYKIMSFLSGKMDCFLTCYGHYEEQQGNQHVFGIVMEYYETNLKQFIEKRLQYDAPFGEEEIHGIVNTLLEGFGMMHKYKIYHCDIKPHNILLTSDSKLKIGGFDVSKIFYSEYSSTKLPDQNSVQGTDGYMPPEIQAHLDAKKLGNSISPLRYRASKVDTYSLGLTFLQIYTFKSVYGFNREQNQMSLRNALENIHIVWFKNLLENMLVFDQKQRKSIKQLFSYLPQEYTIYLS